MKRGGMLCETGVVKVVTKASENKVIVYGAADPSVLLKKMRRHLDKHAMLWPMNEGDQGQVAPPLFPVDPRELQNQERNPGGPSLQTGTAVRLDPRDGRPLVDSRDVRQVERELKDAEMRGGPHGDPREAMSHGPRPPQAADLVHPLERMELRGEPSPLLTRGLATALSSDPCTILVILPSCCSRGDRWT
jgi:hypothetical protein